MKDCQSQYKARIRSLEEVIAWRNRSCRLIQLLRSLLFLLFAACLVAALTGNLSGLLAYVLPGLPLLALFATAAYHETVESRQRSDQIRLSINQQQIRRLERDWAALPQVPFDVPPEAACLSNDLDLFGKASLMKLACIARTPLGIRKMGQWLLEPCSPEEILKRQRAVAELKDEFELREELQLLSHTVAAAQTDPGELLAWADGNLWLDRRKWLLWFGRLSAALVLCCLIGFFFPGAPRMILGGLGLVLVIINIGFTVFYSGSIHSIFNAVGYRQKDVAVFVDLFRLSSRLSEDDACLGEIRQELVSGKNNAVSATGNLRTIIGMAQMRRSGLMFLVYILFQFLFLLDIHTLWWLEKWQRKYGMRVAAWLHSVATLESLVSLSNLAFHQSDWVFPRIDTRESQVVSEQIGHPLLPDQQRVCNDVEIGPADTMLLVTGSNMSGKSTLLRSIGLNCVLAQAGSVVCAKSMSLPPLRIETSMRIGDSISDGVSFFMAELKRLRQITREAEQLEKDPERVLLFLLDEILQGTNSRERQIAVIRVCEHLLESKAIGAISTHDLELAEADKIRSRCRTVHFREFFEQNPAGQQEMKFDYLMRQGTSPTTNALKLLEMVGLGWKEDPPGADSGKSG